jgi:hypothetical protein
VVCCLAACVLAPALSESRTEGGYRTYSIARSTSEDYRDMYDYPAEGTPLGVRVARLRRPTPCRQSSTTTPRSGSADRAPSKDSRGCRAPPAEQRRSRQLCQTHKPLQEVVCGKVAARGRAASPTKRGRIVKCSSHLLLIVFRKGYKSSVPTLYPSFDGRGLSDASCSIARSRPFGRRHRSAALGFPYSKNASPLSILYGSY